MHFIIKSGRSLLFVAFLLLQLQAMAQQIQILDRKSNEPLVGATVRVAGEEEGQISDPQGFVSFNLTEAATLDISFVGYERQQLRAAPNESYTVFMTATTQALSGVTVRGYETGRPLLEVPAAVAVIDAEAFNRYDESSPVAAFNTMTGVRMEQRSPASFRLSIRGSVLRAPFGVRNVKMYWNEIPLTEPNGNTPLNLLDIENMGNVEVIKGPSASLYGAGLGGVVNFTSPKPLPQDNRVQLGYTGGSYGFNRQTAQVNYATETAGIQLSYVNQSADGYRDHSAMDRETIQLLGYVQPSEKQEISVNMFYSSLDYQIPGGLTAEQFAEDPRQARAGSASQNAGIIQNTLNFGISHDIQFSERFGNSTTVYSTFTDFDNPFITDYKKDGRQGGGGRTRFYYESQVAGMPLRLDAGLEFQSEIQIARNFGNVNGQPDTLRFDDELRSSQYMTFLQAQLDISPNWSATVGASYNQFNYDIYRVRDEILDSTYRSARDFAPVLSPRFALLRKLGNTMALHANVSYGFSPPTVTEVRTNEGSINEDLESEKGVNYELGFRGELIDRRMLIDFSMYHLNLYETIISNTDFSSVVLFDNAGSTTQQGLELLVAWELFDPQKSANFWQGRFSHSLTYNHYRFDEYLQAEDFSGNQLTGVAPLVAVSTLDLSIAPGFYTRLTHNYTSEIPLNDANTVYSPSYHLVQARVGWRHSFPDLFNIELFGGVDNLLNESYSLGNDLNAFGGRFFQPSAPRNYFGGIKASVPF